MEKQEEGTNSKPEETSPEVDEDKIDFYMEIPEGTSKRIDFSRFGDKIGEMKAVLYLVTKNEEDTKPILKVQYIDVESYEGDIDKQPYVTKNDVVVEFTEEQSQKEIQFTFADDHEATFSLEGTGSVIIYGCFTPLEADIDGEEEEEEEAHEENQEGENAEEK